MKYDFNLDLETRNSLSILASRINPGSIVLEFGPANGRMTKYLKEQLDCIIYAVEIDEKSAKDAAKYTEKIIVDSIENYGWQEEFKGLKFDYILFADVLEHLYDPEKVLKSVNTFLSNDGSILISIPNISHNSIVMGLLKNEFNYGPIGLLDDTHIRFFTKKTFDILIEKCGYFRTYETAIYRKPQCSEFEYRYSDFIEPIAKYLFNLEHGEIYQLIYELKSYPTNIDSDFVNSSTNRIYTQSTELWERINQAESKLEETKKENVELWKRINQAESQLEETKKENVELWKRINQAESKLHIAFIKYVKRYLKK